MRERQPARPPGDGVAELIAAERRLVAEVARAETAAATVREEAHREAAATLRAAEEELAAELDGARTAAGERLAALLAAEAADESGRLAAWSGATEERLRELARGAVSGVVAELLDASGGDFAGQVAILPTAEVPA